MCEKTETVFCAVSVSAIGGTEKCRIRYQELMGEE